MKNKKWFTLIEIIVVIWIILFILWNLSQVPIENMMKIVEMQNIKDWIVNINNEVRNASYNNITLWQDIITDTTLTTNKQVSRFDTVRDWTNANTKLAYYHAIYFTTLENDPISTVNNDFSNWSFYILQYRQEGYINVKNRILEPFNIDYATSQQLLKANNGTTLWTEKRKIPTLRSYYLNKIVNVTDNCKSWIGQFDSWYILYSTNNLNYTFYKWTTLDKTFNYKFCFSQFPSSYDDSSWLEIIINRDRMWEFFFESLENY